MTKLVAILGGGDWTDASVEHVVINDDVDLDEQKLLYDNWYKTVYRVQMSEWADGKVKKPEWFSFSEYLVKNEFARKANENDVVEFFDD